MLELSVRQRRGDAGLDQILRLVLQVPEIGAGGERTWCLVGIGRHATSFHQNARCPHIGLKEGSRDSR